MQIVFFASILVPFVDYYDFSVSEKQNERIVVFNARR